MPARFSTSLTVYLILPSSISARGVEIQIDVHVVERALTGLAPDHQSGRTQALAMQQDFTGGHGAGIDDVRVGRRDLADVRRIVNDHALADGEAQVFGALCEQTPG